MKIKVFQIDDWAFVAAETQKEAEEFISKEYERPDDVEDQECEEATNAPNAQECLAAHVAEGGTFPALLGINQYYA
jgi:hypothetical protein